MTANQQSTEVGHQAGLEIRLTKRTHAFPWSQYLFAEGDSDEILIAFSTHSVIVKGTRLDALLTKINDHSIGLLKVPARAESFGQSSVPQISDIFVKKIGDDQE
jgi:hypothetical protein